MSIYLTFSSIFDNNIRFRYNLYVKKFNTFNKVNALTEMGLSEKEALIYLSALNSGGGTISQLAAAGNIDRTGIYYYIEKLEKLGLLQAAERGKRRIFVPADPIILKKIVEDKQKHLLDALPRMEQVFSRQTNKSIIEYYQGKDERDQFYDRVYELISTLEPPYNTIYIMGLAYKTVTNVKELRSFMPPQEQLNIITKAILPMSEKSKAPGGNKRDPYLVTRYNLPDAQLKFISDKYSYPGAITIVGDYVALYDYKNLTYSITENKNIATTWRMFFEYIWDSLDKK